MRVGVIVTLVFLLVLALPGVAQYSEPTFLEAMGYASSYQAPLVTGAQTACVPSTEICDQIDNDCDGDIDEDFVCDKECVAGKSRPCGCDCADAKVLMVLDDNHHNEDLDDYELNYENLLELGVDVTRINEPTNGLTYDMVSSYDLVWFANPGWPIDDQLTLDTLQQYFENGNPVVFQGDDLTWGHGTIIQNDLESFTGLENINNGKDADYLVEFADIDHPLLHQLRGKSFTYKDDDIDTNKIIASDVVELAHGTLKSNSKFNGSAIVLRDHTDQGKGIFLLTLLTLSKIEPRETAVTFTGNIINYMLNQVGKCTCGSDEGQCQFSTQTCQSDGTWGSCEGVPPVLEICDGLDNNCDGEIDERLNCECNDGDTRSCGTDEGICSVGQQVCVRGQWGDCTGGQQAQPPETCDGLDNDCDGFVDEGIDDIIEGTNEGECQTQITSCNNGVMEVIQLGITPQTETCDSLDNDCDGAADERNVCEAEYAELILDLETPVDCDLNGTLSIANDADDMIAENVVVSLTVTRGAEYVERIEYNPNVGTIDPKKSVSSFFTIVPSSLYDTAPDESPIELTLTIESVQSMEQQPLSLTTTSTKVTMCHIPPNDPTNPQTISVDAADVPTHLARGDKLGSCDDPNVGKKTTDVVKTCPPPCTPSVEVCDGEDNDCDGEVDEEILVQCGQTDIGTCSFGHRTCDNGALSACIGEIIPDIESCNGLDDDCDGHVDEDLFQTCGSDEGICSTGSQQCVNGDWGECGGTLILPQIESCNGLDDDCDGDIDNGLRCDCVNGDTRSCGSDEGVCSSGIQTCESGQWGSCVGEVLPSLEVCDAQDNDCDGLIDETLTRSCGDSDVGQCSLGTQTCRLGNWGVCEGEKTSQTETCNALDDDCDGHTDESVTQQCGTTDVGACSFGQRVCSLGVFGNCVGAIDPVPETCNGIDDNCNGLVDDAIADIIEGSDIGACQPKITQCAGGQLLVVQNLVGPSVEVCDGIDNDCNGLIDDNLPDITDGSDVGVCQSSIRRCIGGNYQLVQVGIGPSLEVCDNLDNDCDNLVDEGIDPITTGSDVGSCQAEILSCVDGSMQRTQQQILPTAEICDGQDNNCDGAIDNDIAPQESGSSEGECSPEITECITGQWIVTSPEIGPSTETCDLLDNDCDGIVDNDITPELFGSDTGECRSGKKECIGGSMVIVDQGLGPSREVCDALDNNCNDAVDDGITCSCLLGDTQSCGTDVGECQTGVMECTNGEFGQCVGEVSSTSEVCDGLDNDCDGIVDNNIVDIVTGSSVGECQSQINSCVNGQMTITQQLLGPSLEICDGLDNDCDGLIDEEIADIVSGNDVGVCTPSVQRCINGDFVEVESQTTGSTEICDGLDNDCDGVVDEGILDIVEGNNQGECQSSVRRCQGGDFVLITPAIGPLAEVCDGLDNDCDGEVDNGIDTIIFGSDIGECQSEVRECIGGQMRITQTLLESEQEVCDGLDNDCDGMIDEDIDDIILGISEGECAPEIKRCLGGQFSLIQQRIDPDTEICDGLDNDCDGVVDESLTKTCGSDMGSCEKGTQTCSQGVWGDCIGQILPTMELCDGEDNDCDGVADELLVNTCGSDIGQCQKGISVCTLGAFAECSGSVSPVDEICNGLDDNCNGLVDDGVSCECLDGETQSCGTDVGVCSSGTQTCNGGVWGSCVGEVLGTDEICDGLDNDCDGQSDENLFEIFGSDVGSCSLGRKECTNGAYLIVEDETLPSVEICDGFDNDCDGVVDEELYRSCGTTDVGACEFGLQICSAGVWGQCQGNIEPTLETCNNIDDDCNGFVDNGITDLFSGSAVGECREEQQSCINGDFRIVQTEQTPELEVCDGLDNDCDGVVDESIDDVILGTDIGECQSQITRCVGGVMQEIQTAQVPSVEICNSLDDDCDGVVDDGLICECLEGESRECGSNIGSCQSGTQHCTGGVWGSCEGMVDASLETCNSVDDDCDGLIDEDIADIIEGNDEGVCAAQITSCVDGSMSIVQESVGSSEEICDGVDNDCDGHVDEDLPFEFVGSDVGVCISAGYSCVDGATTLVREEVGPSEEICDGLDNDCDGEIDEGIVDVVEGNAVGVCRPQVTSCVDGQLTIIQDPILPLFEQCNGVDDDCDGLVDEDVGEIILGTNTGECQTGITSCTDGSLVTLQEEIGAVFETCNGLDDDCDGQTDEDIDCGCVEDEVRSCGSGVGVCQEGTQTCNNGLWGPCVGTIDGTTEVCDGLDNDCDGEIDELVTAQVNGTSAGVCQPTITECRSGVLFTVQSSFDPLPETCDGLDNDCNGLIDDGLRFTKETKDVGSCQPEIWDCVDGNMTLVQTEVNPVTETCNGVDDDCDGHVDEGCAPVFTPKPNKRKKLPVSEDPFRQPLLQPRVITPAAPNTNTLRPSGPSISSPPSVSNKPNIAVPPSITPAKSDSPNIIRKKRTPRYGIKLIMGDLPTQLSPGDSVVKVPALVKNVGDSVLNNIVAASAPATSEWKGNALPIDTLAPGEEKPVTFELRPFYCSNNLAEGEYRLPLTNEIPIEFVAEETGVVSDSASVKIPLSTQSLMVYSPPKNYAKDPNMKVCYFVANPSKAPKDRFEIEFEMFDRRDDLIIDYLSPIEVGEQEILLKVRDYKLASIPREKPYYLRGFLYENGSLFSQGYLVGEDRSTVDLSTLEKQETGWEALKKRVQEVIS